MPQHFSYKIHAKIKERLSINNTQTKCMISSRRLKNKKGFPPTKMQKALL